MSSTTIAILHRVKPGQTQAFEATLKQVIQQAQTFEGYEGIQIIAPAGAQKEYLLLVRFDQLLHYQRWEASEARQKGAAALQPYLQEASEIRYQEGLEFWFTPVADASPRAPTKWKMALLTWLVIYPLILILSALAGQYLAFLAPAWRMLLVSMLLVTTMTYVLMPQITRIFAFWIFESRE